MDVLEGGDRIVGLTEIPNIEARVLVVVVSDYKLSSQLWIPHHASPLGLLVCLFSGVIEVRASCR